MVEEQFAGRIEPNAARQPLEKLGAELLLKAVDAPGQRRRGDVHVFGRFSHRAGAGDSLDKSECLQVFHRSDLGRCIFCTASVNS